jgi:hypothetical protein
MKFWFHIFIVGELSIGCTACIRPEISFVVFPKTEHLFVSGIKQTEEVAMRYPFRVRKNDSCLYVMDLHGNEYYCHEFDYPSMRHRRSLAKRGGGPDEFTDAENIRLTRQAYIWILDANKAKINCFPASENSVFKSISLDKQLIRSLDFDLYEDSLFIVPDYTGTHRFDILHPDGTVKESRGQIPIRKRDKDIPNLIFAQAWRGFLDYNPDSGLLAIATQLGEVIEIYSLPGDSLVNVMYGKEGEPRFHYGNGYAAPNGIMGYSDVFVGEKYIYALFWGHSFKDIRNNSSSEGGNRIQVFDLAGNPVKQYILDCYITGFFIDEEKATIIGLDVNSDQQVVEFNGKQKR